MTVLICPHCGNEDETLLCSIGFVTKGDTPDHPERGQTITESYHCEVCSKDFTIHTAV